MTDKGLRALLMHCSNAYGPRFPLPDTAEAMRSKLATWRELLCDLSDEQGLAAARRHCSTSPHPPTPADLRNLLCLGGLRMSASEAWELVWSAACIGGSTERGPDPSWPPEVLRAVRVVGWRSITLTEFGDVQWVQKRFEAAFGDFEERAHRELERGRALGEVPDGLLPRLKTVDGACAEIGRGS